MPRLLALCAAIAATAAPCPAAHAGALEHGVPREPYNRRDYALSYKVFLNAGEVRNAYEVALVAVKNRPKDRTWRARLAQTALWTGHDHVALRAMVYLARHGDLSYIKPAWTLASGLSAFTRLTQLLALRLQRHPNAPALVEEMSSLYQIQGHPRRAIMWLEAAMRKDPHRRYLWAIITLEDSLGERLRELAALRDYERRYGPTSRVLLTEASLLYRGGHTGRAYHLLKRHAAQISKRHFRYYHTLGALAWARQDFAVARTAARVLYAQGIASRADLIHLVLLDEKKHPQASFLLALEGYRRYHAAAFFFTMLNLAERLHSPALLIKAFAQTRRRDDAALVTHPYYWTQFARYQTLQGHGSEAEGIYRTALRRFPGNTNILESYLWFFVATDKAPRLAATLPSWARTVDANRPLWLPYALCLLRIDAPRLALPYLKALLARHPDDPQLLLPFADALARSGRGQEAISVRRRAFAELFRPQVRPPRHERRMRADLAMSLATAPVALSLLPASARAGHGKAGRDLLLGYALARGAYAPAAGAIARDRGHAPAWAMLATALAERNGAQLRALLVHHRRTLPRGAQVDAASAIGEPARAISEAFASLNQNRSDGALAHHYRHLLLAQSDRVSQRTRYLQSAGFSVMGAEINVRHMVNPNTEIEAGARDDLIQRTDATLIGTTPPFDRSEYFRIGLLRRSGASQLTLGRRSAVTRFAYAQASLRASLWPHTSQTLRLNYHARASDLPALYLGGVKNGFSLENTDTLTARDSLDAKVAYRSFRGQGGGDLGTGLITSLGYDHKIWRSYPDITVDAALSFAHYRAAQTLPSDLVALLPAGSTGLGPFALQSYAQAGVGIHFGDRYRRHYSPDLRPFLDLDVFEDSVTHAGYDVTVGLATPVIGPDHLAIYYMRSQGGIGIENRLQAVGLRYSYHFKP